MKYLKVLGLAAALATLPVLSHAEWAYTAADADLMAGPAADYPVVIRLGAGLSISVEGCMPDYQWCDVTSGPYRGWMYAGNIVYPYQGTNVPVLTYGAVIGFGIVAFSIGDYWDRHYRARPWYPQRQLWIDRPRPVYAPGYPPGYRPLPQPVPRTGQTGTRPPQPQTQPQPPGGGQRHERVQPSDPAGPSPQTRRPGPGQHPPQGHPPEGAQHPQQGQTPSGGQRPPQRQPPTGDAPPQGQGPAGR